MSYLEEIFNNLWIEKYPQIELKRQYKHIPKRRFRADFAHLPSKTIIEIQGGRWIKGGHTSGKGLESDCEKTLISASQGWIILPLVDSMITDESIETIYSIIKERENILNGYYKILPKRRSTRTNKSTQKRRRNRPQSYQQCNYTSR
ncbi:MAG: hypothetical protein MGG11_06515 [Trichodesmium sp. MAG_R03]|nr:hypothetical protein [Trichodesmium sp. MAG_R03]